MPPEVSVVAVIAAIYAAAGALYFVLQLFG